MIHGHGGFNFAPWEGLYLLGVPVLYGAWNGLKRLARRSRKPETAEPPHPQEPPMFTSLHQRRDG